MTSAAPLAVTALGMVTSLGTNAVTSCAAARAGLAMPSPVGGLDVAGEALFGRETRDGPPEIFGHAVRGVADEYSGFARLALLAEAALADVLERRALSAKEIGRTALSICVSDQRVIEDASGRASSEASASQRRGVDLLDRLAHHEAWAAAPAKRVCRCGGAAAFASAIADAATQIALGHVDRFVLGAVDSRLEPRSLRAAAKLGQLRTRDNPAGAMPGEAAAFVIVERASDVPALAYIASASASVDPLGLLDAERAPNGVHLAASLRAAASGQRIDWVVADLTGTSRRAVEWGNALARVRDLLGDAPIWTPARSFGDVGAAAGAIGVAVAARAFERGYASGRAALVSLSSESGEKGAILVGGPHP